MKASRRGSMTWWMPFGYLAFGVLWILGSDYVLGRVLPADPAGLLWLSTSKGLGFVVLSALWFHLALRAKRWTPSAMESVSTPVTLRVPILALLALMAAMAIIGQVMFRTEEQGIRDGRFRELSAAAELQAARIAGWFAARERALDQLSSNRFLGAAVTDWQTAGDAKAGTLVTEHLESLLRNGPYDAVSLHGPDGRLIVAAGRPVAPDAHVAVMIERARETREVQHGPIRDHDGMPSSAGVVEFAVPIVAGGPEDAVAAWIVVLWAPAPAVLGQLRLESASLGRTFETLVVRRRGQEIVYVGSLAEPGRDGLTVEVTADRADLPAARIIAGERGLLTGRDYRSRLVLATGRAVRGTDLHVVAKIDAVEAFAPLRRATTISALVMLFVLALATAAIVAWWRRYQRRVAADLVAVQSEVDLQRQHFAMANRFANDAVLLMDEGRRVIECNDRATDLYGYSRAELRAMRVDDLRAADTDEVRKVPAQFERALSAGQLRFEAVHHDRHGRLFPVEVSSRRFELDGRPYVQSIIRDITERRRSEASLRESERRYRDLFEANPHPMWVYDLQTLEFLAVNDAAVRHYGYSREQFLSITIADIRPADDLPRLLSNVRKVRDGTLDEAGIWRHRKADGSIIDVEIRSHVMDFAGRRAELVLANDVTLRLTLESKLRESESQMRLFIEHAPAALAMFDNNMCYLAVSTRWLEDYGLGSGGLAGLSHYEVFPEIGESWKAVHRRGLAGEVIRAEEDRFERADGSVQWLRWEVRPWSTDGGSIGGIVVFSEDVTAIVDARTHLERRTRLYDLLSQCNQAIVRCKDRESLYQEIVRHAIERGRFVLAFMAEQGPAGCLIPVAAHGPSRRYLDGIEIRADGEVSLAGGPSGTAWRTGRTVVANDFLHDPVTAPWHDRARDAGIGSSAAFPVHFGGQVTAVFNVCAEETAFFGPDVIQTLEEVASDVSFALETFEVRRQRDESQRLLQSVIDASEAPIYVFSLEGIALMANAACARAMGGEVAAIIGRSRDELLPAAVARQHRANDLQVLEGTKSVTFEETNVAEGGGVVYLSTKFPLYDTRGRLFAVGGISADITELRRMQRELEAVNVGLEARVAERTRELLAAKHQAEAADRAKTAFLATMSHELRSPLNSIIGFTSVLLEGLSGPLSEAQAQQLRIVQDASRHLLDIINDMLDLSKIEADAMTISRQPYDLSAVVRRLSDRFTLQAEEKQLFVRLEGLQEPRHLLGDSRRVEQILANLVSNAIKFTQSGGVTVSVTETAEKVRVTVSDTGCGIADEDRPRLFRRFSQIDPGAGSLTHGTGLGLAIAHGLADAMGGRIELDSTPGAGSTFTLELPRELA